MNGRPQLGHLVTAASAALSAHSSLVAVFNVLGALLALPDPVEHRHLFAAIITRHPVPRLLCRLLPGTGGGARGHPVSRPRTLNPHTGPRSADHFITSAHPGW